MGAASNSTFDYDAELSRYYQHLRAAMDVQPDDTVLDIGCGTGQTTREAAKLATQGSALGVDVSPAMVTRARQLAEGLHNVRFAEADAQVHPFEPEHFTLGVSRFGTMFFADPVKAFTNIRRALAPGARLVQLVWQGSDQQEWVAEINLALAGEIPEPATTGAFSLADPASVDGLLTSAGFVEVSVTEVREPVFYGVDADAAVNGVLALMMTSDLLTRLDAEETEQAVARLRSTMVKHTSTDGVWFDSRAWLITARR
ncbi:class I SAM-dependent methyltransferase [Kibdelosporangium aridum]|uniref:Class I SAM-dependent methyltransferase n=1 Tax=Kibdelosporangium aridum TaxID=2030 RepID=A0A428YWP4_KIBAR|nr:class I SAM-dependent methyltransferase [Kibdelosporangium aridum]RSM74591.1 class I SAM-dependent methyltransferase [Kibdelosporangium aridum]